MTEKEQEEQRASSAPPPEAPATSGPPHVYLKGQTSEKDGGVELRGLWEYAPGVTSHSKCERLQFWYARTRKREGEESPSWAGDYEGWFVLKNVHGREQKVSESFALWREEQQKVAGRGSNSYGNFWLGGHLDQNGAFVLERIYGAKATLSRKKRAPGRRRKPQGPLSPEEAVPVRVSKRQRVVRWHDDEPEASEDEEPEEAVRRRRAPNNNHGNGAPGTSKQQRPSKAGSEKSFSSSEDERQRSGGGSRRAWCDAVFDEEQSEIYEGQVCPRTGLRHGLGVCVYVSRSNQMYEGEWKQGREHGRGAILTRDRKLVFDGEFVDGKTHGRGAYIFSNGDAYHGEWRENCRHGTGEYVFANDRGSYLGDWRDNVRHGRGKLVDADGSTYEGEWVNDRRHGKGSLRLADGLRYDGVFADDAFDGRGVCVYPDGQRYEGMWRNGRKDGRGSLVWPNGASYEGRFKDDAIDGQGTLSMTKPTACCDDKSDNCILIPIDLKTDMAKIHLKAGFHEDGN